MSSLRLPVAALLVLLGPAFTAASEQPADGAAERVLLNRYCVTCHNDSLRVAGLALDTVDVTRVGDHAEIWEKVVASSAPE